MAFVHLSSVMLVMGNTGFGPALDLPVAIGLHYGLEPNLFNLILVDFSGQKSVHTYQTNSLPGPGD